MKGLPSEIRCGCKIEMAVDGKPVNHFCAAHLKPSGHPNPFLGPPPDEELVIFPGQNPGPLLGIATEVNRSPRVALAKVRFTQEGTQVLQTLATEQPKPGRGGRRANQKGRPRKLKDAVSRSFTLERRLVERLERIAAANGRSVADLARTALELGVKTLEWSDRDKASGGS